jgi:hypothetical protein
MKKGRVSKVGFALAVTSGGFGGFGLGSSLYRTVWGDEFDGSRSGSAIQFGAVEAAREVRAPAGANG